MSGLLPRPDHIFEANFWNTTDGPVWTDLTGYVELQQGIKTGRRRQTVFDDVAPGTFDIYLDNTAGTFNNDKGTSPFLGVINLDVPVRFRLRYPRVPLDTNNMLSDVQSLASDSSAFTCDQGALSVDITSSPIAVDDDDTTITYAGTWTNNDAMTSDYYNSTDHYSATASATCTYAFTGTWFTWQGWKGPTHGIANVSVDGAAPVAVDCYQASGAVTSLYTVTGLAPAQHTVVITVTATKNGSATGYWVDVDAFVSGVTPSPPTGQTYDLVWNTSPLDQTGVAFMTGNGPTRGPDDHPIYVKPSTAYNARAKIKCDANGTGISFQASLRMRWFDISGTLISESTSGAVTLTTSYQSVSVSGTSPSNAASVRLGVFNETVVGPTVRTITFTGGDSQNQRNSQGNSITIPGTALVGDTALVWHRIANNSLTITAPSGWTAVNSWSDARAKTTLYRKTLAAADINKSFQWIASAKCKQLLLLACYDGVNQATPLHQQAESTETVFRTTHTTPNVTTTIGGCFIHSAVLDLSTATSAWSAPGGEVVEEVNYVTGGNSPTGLCSDTGAVVSAGTYGSKVFTSNVASRYVTMHTLGLGPAAGTGPGNVCVQAGAFELVQGSLSSWQQGGHWESKFSGLVDSWKETFSGDLVMVEVAATDREKQLATINIGPAVYEDILSTSPIAYYKLDESSPATGTSQEAANSADTSQPTLTQVKYGSGAGSGTNNPLDWGSGVGPGVDGSSALIFNPLNKDNGYGLTGTLETPISNASAVTLIQWFNSSMANDSSTHILMRLQNGTAGSKVKVSLDLRGQPATNIQAWGRVATEAVTYDATATKSAQYFDSKTHMLAATYQLTGGQLVTTLFIDGAQQATTSTACLISEFPTISSLTIASDIPASPYLCSGTFSHAAICDYALDSSTIADIWAAGNTAFAGDTVDQRISRICDWEGQDSLDLDASTTVLDRHMPDSQSLLAAVQQAARSEGGTTYIDGEGNIAFRSRVGKENTATPLLVVSSSLVDPGSFTKSTDDTLLVNKPAIKRLSNSVVATVIDAASVAMHGTYEKDIDTILASDADAKDYAAYVMAFYSNPYPRCDQVKIDALLLQDWTHVLLIDMWEIVHITDMPTTETVPTLDLYIEGWEFEMDQDSWWVTFDTSTAIPFGILNDAVRGICGQAVVGW